MPAAVGVFLVTAFSAGMVSFAHSGVGAGAAVPAVSRAVVHVLGDDPIHLGNYEGR